MENRFKHPVHHFQIQVSNFQKSTTFYGELLGRLGFSKVFETEGTVEWQKEGTRIIVAQSPKRFLADGYHRKRVGLNHIAFRAPTRAAVDELYHNYLVPKKIPTLYGGPKEWRKNDTVAGLPVEAVDREEARREWVSTREFGRIRCL